MHRITITTNDGETHVYTRCVGGNLASGYLLPCGEDGPAYIGTAGYHCLQAVLASNAYGGDAHNVCAIVDGEIVILTTPHRLTLTTPTWTPEPKSEFTLDPILVSIVQRKLNGEDVGHPLTYYVRHLAERAKKHVKDNESRQRKRGLGG